jgi:hypothetical protein
VQIKEIMGFEEEWCAKRQSQMFAPGPPHLRTAHDFFNCFPLFPRPDDIFFACISPII